MNFAAADAVVQALLYEGYALYPYRPSVKNRHRWTLGGLYPRAWCDNARTGDAWFSRTECLVEGSPRASLEAHVRFLHLAVRDDWEEAVERQVRLGPFSLETLEAETVRVPFRFEGDATRGQDAVSGVAELSAFALRTELHRVRFVVENAVEVQAETRSAALRRSLASAHAVIGVAEARFVSAIDPPEAFRAESAGCKNEGTWPVLVGTPERGDLMLSSPVILYDFPKLAPESPGELFDGTEIDEILSLRILTLTDDEKRAARATDPRIRSLLDRVESMDPAALQRLHGRLQRHGAGPEFAVGDRVRLRPNRRADALDVLLAGKAATVTSLQRDVEGNGYVTVTIDEDPGREWGETGQPGHRFFFGTDEVERL